MTETTTPITVQNDLVGTDQTIAPKAAAPVETVTRAQIRAMVAAAGSNPALLTFPTDKWGFTSKIKSEILKAASTVRGSEDKHELLIGTLAVLIAHINARKVGDAELQRSRLERIRREADERGPRERVTGTVVNNVPVALPEE